MIGSMMLFSYVENSKRLLTQYPQNIICIKMSNIQFPMMKVQLKPTWKLDIENSTLDIKDLAEAKFSVLLFEKCMY
jgi:hypothetical protein